MNKDQEPLVMPPRFLPRDLLDICLGLPIGLFQTAILLGLPAILAYIPTRSTVIAFVAFCVANGIFLLFVVRRITMTTDGIRFHRILGSPKFLSWDRIKSIKLASRSELIVHGWLWPIFPSREITFSLSAIQHYRVTWQSGFCYYPPADPQQFEKFAFGKLQNRSSDQEITEKSGCAHFPKQVIAVVSFFAAALITTGICWIMFVSLLSDLIVIGSVVESRIGEQSDRIDVYVKDGHRDQHFFVAVNDLHFLKGDYHGNSMGIRLHSPAMTLGIRDKHPEGCRYVLFLKRATTRDGRTILLLNEHLGFRP